MKSAERDLTRGPMGQQIIRISIPLMLSSLLQMLFNLADQAVVGRFAGSMALGSVGSTSTLVALFTAFLMGMGGGSNVVIARNLGAKSKKDVRQSVSTAFLLCLGTGVVVMALGLGLARPLLRLMKTREELIDDAIIYLRIYSLGMPAIGIYNFGRATFNAMGETKKPFYFMLAAGVLNLALNLFFVIGLHLDVVGVAVASVLSVYLSAVLIVGSLMRHRGVCRLRLKRLRLYADKAKEIAGLGMTAGFQEASFAIANLVLQSAVNSFDSFTVAGHTAALNADNITFAIMGAFWTAGSSFMGQNLGAGNKERFHKAYRFVLVYTFITGVICGGLFICFGRPFLSLFTRDAQVVDMGMYRLFFLSIAYPFCVAQDTSMFALRCLGKKLVPLLIALAGIVVFRLIWIFTVFAHYHTLPSLYLLYIFSFVLCGTAQTLYFRHCDKKYWAARAEAGGGAE